MTSTKIDHIAELSKDVFALHGQGSLEECIAKLGEIREKLFDVERDRLDSNTIQNLCDVLKDEICNWTNECNIVSVQSLEVCAQALFCLRNSFVNCSTIQLMVAETDNFRDSILSVTKWVFTSKHTEDNTSDKSVRENEESVVNKWQINFSKLAMACVTCLGNLVAANSTTRSIVWPYLSPMLQPLLTFPEKSIGYISSMVIFNCLLEQELKEDFCRCSNVDDVIRSLLDLYLDAESSDEKTVCFVLYTLEMVLCCDGRINSIWQDLSENQQLLVLDILSNILEGKSGSNCGSLSSSSISFLVDISKNDADSILRTHASESKNDSALVIARLFAFLGLLATSEEWKITLKEDNSLLITTVSLLRCMNDIGSVQGNAFSRMGLDDLANKAQVEKAESHPAYGFKRDLIRLIASLVYRHKANQDQVRELGGLTQILESSQFDGRNPGIKEASIYAVRNLLEGNLENQEVIKALEYQGQVENQSMQISKVNGVTVVQGASSLKEDEEENHT